MLWQAWGGLPALYVVDAMVVLCGWKVPVLLFEGQVNGVALVGVCCSLRAGAMVAAGNTQHWGLQEDTGAASSAWCPTVW